MIYHATCNTFFLWSNFNNSGNHNFSKGVGGGTMSDAHAMLESIQLSPARRLYMGVLPDPGKEAYDRETLKTL